MKSLRLALTAALALVSSIALATPAAAQLSEWRRVQALAPSTLVVVSRDDAPGARDRTVVYADPDVLVVLNLTGANLSERNLASLVDAADRFTRPTAGRVPEEVTSGAVRIGADGVWVGGQRIGDVDQRLERIRRPVIAEIREPGRRVGSKIGAIVGAAGGALIGFGLAAGIATENPCGSSCADEKFLIGASVVGIPVGAGFLGYHLGAKRTLEVIYRR